MTSIKYYLFITITFILFNKSFAQTNNSDLFSVNNVKGSTTIFDLKNAKWYYTDEKDAHIGTLPASTFKIVNSLIALETKAISTANDTLKWDGKEKSHLGTVITAWNQDTDLKGAFKNSTIWFYEVLSQKIGKKKYKKTLKKLKYGNGDISQAKDDFWNYGDFEVTPKNQVEFLIQLSQNQLPFSPENMDLVKEMMVLEKKDNTILRGKTGWTLKDCLNIGWFIGYLSTNDNQYFFATRVIDSTETKNPYFAKSRVEITNKVLNDYIQKTSGK